MKKLLKFLSTLIILFLACLNSYSQCAFIDPPPPPPPTGNQALAILDSKNGWYVPCSGTLRVLVVFVEVDYSGSVVGDPTPPNGFPLWHSHHLPSWANALFDANTPIGPATGELTRYYQLASSGQYNLIGDYLMSPTNNGIFQLPYNGGWGIPTVCAAVNAAMAGNFVTGNNLNNASFFDNWTKTNPGTPKITPSTDSPIKYDHVMFIFRNLINVDQTGWSSYTGMGAIDVESYPRGVYILQIENQNNGSKIFEKIVFQ